MKSVATTFYTAIRRRTATTARAPAKEKRVDEDKVEEYRYNSGGLRRAADLLEEPGVCSTES